MQDFYIKQKLCAYDDSSGEYLEVEETDGEIYRIKTSEDDVYICTIETISSDSIWIESIDDEVDWYHEKLSLSELDELEIMY